MKNNNLVNNYTQGNIMKQLVLFTAPLFLSNILQLVYNTVDMIVVGRINGDIGLSAVSVGGDIASFLTVLVMGYSNAGQIIISQFIGADKKDYLGRIVGTLFTFLMTVAIVLSIVCLLLRESILSWMNTPSAAWSGAYDYSTVSMVGLIFIFGYNIISAVLRGMGNSKHPFLFVSIATIINVILDLLFVVTFKLGAYGAGLATVISQAISFLCSIVFLYRRRHQLGFELNYSHFRIDWSMLKIILKLGTPMAITGGSVLFSKLFINSYINAYGVVISAITGIGNKLTLMSNLISQSVSTAGATMVAQNIGAKSYKRVPQIMISAFSLTLSLAMIFIVAIKLWPNQIFGLFANDAALLSAAMAFVPVAILAFLGGACRAPVGAFTNGVGNPRINFAVAILDALVMRIGLGLLLGIYFHMEYAGFWYGNALAGFTPVFIGLTYYATGRWKTREQIIQQAM